MNEFVSWCRHLLVSFLFHALTSLHPPSFHRNDFSTCAKPRDVFFAPRARRKSRVSGISRGKLEAGRNELGLCTARYESKGCC